MSIRETINKNQTAVIIVAGVLIAGALSFMLIPDGNNPGDNKIYYTDMVTGKIFEGYVSDGSPTTSPDGNEAYRADVYTCGKCEDGAWFVAGLLRETPEGIIEVSIDGKKWVTTMNGEYIAYVTKKTECPGGMVAASCYPPR